MELTDRQMYLAMSNLQLGCPRIARNAAQHKMVSLLIMKEIWVFCLVWVVLCVLSVYVFVWVHACVYTCRDQRFTLGTFH